MEAEAIDDNEDMSTAQKKPEDTETTKNNINKWRQ